MAPRRQFELDADLAVLRRLADDEKRRVERIQLAVLSSEHQLQLEKFQALSLEEAQACAHKLPLEVSMQLSLLGTKAVAENPYHYSDLPRWLGFETWLPRDALLLLAGVSPTAALVDWTYENFMGVEIDQPKIRTASDLNGIYDRYSIPSPSDWSEDIREIKNQLQKEKSQEKRRKLEQELKSYEALRDEPSTMRRAIELQHRSKILAALSDHWFSGDHDPEKRYSPEHFISWANARGYKPEWYEWGRSNSLLNDHETVYRAPYFDPDSDDYPELLHIALRAWEETRAAGEGTPKQRIERFLQQRYPSLRPTTRELIAQIANWQRTGGRPKM